MRKNTALPATPAAVAASEAPSLPPVPLLPVPQPRPGMPAPRSSVRLVSGLAASSQAAAAARRNAQAARQGIERLVQSADSTLASLAGALKHHDANAEAPEQWQREGVAVDLVKSFAADLQALLAKYTETSAPPAASAPEAAPVANATIG